MTLTGLKKILLSVHFFTVIALIALTLFPLAWPISLPEEFWIKQVIIYFIWAGLFYLNLLFMAPQLLYKNKIAEFVIAVVLLLVFMVYFNRLLDDLLGVAKAFERTFKAIGYKHTDTNSHTTDYVAIITALVIFGMSTVVASSRKNQLDKLNLQAIEQEKISTELLLLKAQINPHFFFNILHTIYALADSNTNAAKDAIYTLSHMMRYVIYETKNDKTTLEKEIKFAEDYVKLMKLRLSDGVQVIFEKQENFINYDVAPMLFLPFIENAFKHGVSTVYPSYVYIDLRQYDKKLQIEIKNSLFEEQAAHQEESNGIGVANTMRRLDLLYADHYTLSVEKDLIAREYTVVLTLNFV